MSCEACRALQNAAEAAAPHQWLVAARHASRLRPFGRPPIVLQAYRCIRCNTNWMHEADPLQGMQSSWICLHQGSSILDPVSVSEQEITTSTANRSVAREQPTPDTPSLAYRFT